MHGQGVNSNTFVADNPMTSLCHTDIHSTHSNDVRRTPVNRHLCSCLHSNHPRTVIHNSSSDCHAQIVGLSCTNRRTVMYPSTNCHVPFIVRLSCTYTWQYSGGTSATPPPKPTKTCFFFCLFSRNFGLVPPLRGGTVGAQILKSPFWGSKIFRAPPARGLVTALLCSNFGVIHRQSLLLLNSKHVTFSIFL